MFKSITSAGVSVTLLTLLGLSACVETPPQSPGTAGGIATTGIERQSGISTDALFAVSYLASERFFVIFYSPKKIDAAQKAAAPARLCESRGLKVGAVEDKPLEHPEEMPGAMKLVVRCK